MGSEEVAKEAAVLAAVTAAAAMGSVAEAKVAAV